MDGRGGNNDKKKEENTKDDFEWEEERKKLVGIIMKNGLDNNRGPQDKGFGFLIIFFVF